MAVQNWWRICARFPLDRGSLSPAWGVLMGTGLLDNWPFLSTTIYLVGALLLAALILALLGRWRRSTSESPSPVDQLGQFRKMLEQGIISQEEFESLRANLGGKLKRQLKMAPPSGSALTPPQRTTPEANASDNQPPPPEPPDEGIRPA